MIGGPHSFGPGGYRKSAVEQALPVDMIVRNPERIPTTAVLVLLDKSGSMSGIGDGASKIDVAKIAATELAGQLTSRDRIGLIAFDAAAKWVVPLAPAGDPEQFRISVGSLRGGGGTDAYPALEIARDALGAIESQARHVIFTDSTLRQPGLKSKIGNQLGQVVNPDLCCLEVWQSCSSRYECASQFSVGGSRLRQVEAHYRNQQEGVTGPM